MDLRSGHSRTLRDMERMVPALDHVELNGRPELVDHGAQLIGRAERIARALHEQHRNLDRAEMPRALLLWPTRRVQRIAEQHETGDVGTFRCDLRGDAAAHRLAADDDPVVREAL